MATVTKEQTKKISSALRAIAKRLDNREFERIDECIEAIGVQADQVDMLTPVTVKKP